MLDVSTLNYWKFFINRKFDYKKEIMKTKILQLTSGRGPSECCWVVAKVLKKMLTEAKQLGLETEVLHRIKGAKNGTLVSAVLEISGNEVRKFISDWVGIIQWVGRSSYRKLHKRKNWFIGVNLLEFSSAKYEMKPTDLKFETCRSSGAGGQHVNKVESSVKLTHLPTGISTTCSVSRSQYQNKKKAKEKLSKLLQIKALEQRQIEASTYWQAHNKLRRGNPIKIFHGTDFKSSKKKKSYRSKRQQLKNDLRKN